MESFDNLPVDNKHIDDDWDEEEPIEKLDMDDDSDDEDLKNNLKKDE